MKICIIGSGVVGKASGIALIEKGHGVVFCDNNKERLEELNAENHKVTTPQQITEYNDIDIIFICVPTPTKKNGATEIKYLTEALQTTSALLKTQNKFTTVAIRSTVPVGTSQWATRFIEKETGKNKDTDFTVCAHPEYLREKSALSDARSPWIIIVGTRNQQAVQMLKELYKSFDTPLTLMSETEAEMHKYVHNLFNANKISFFNEQRIVCNALNLDADTIFKNVVKSAEGATNPQYGIHNLGPFAGNCLPKDTSAFLYWVKKNLKIRLLLLQAVIKINKRIKKSQ